MTGDDDEMFMTRSLNITPKTTEQHLIVCNDISVAYVTNNKRQQSYLLHMLTVQLEAFCGAVGFHEMSDASISAACQNLCPSSTSQFSYENCGVLARHILLPPVPQFLYFQ